MEIDTDTLLTLKLDPTGFKTVSSSTADPAAFYSLLTMLLPVEQKVLVPDLLHPRHTVVYLTLKNHSIEAFLVWTHKAFVYQDASGASTELAMPCVVALCPPNSKELLDLAFSTERVSAAGFAYSRPSPDLLAFLSEEYRLVQYTPQPSEIVVFQEYFTIRNRERRGYQLATVQRRPDSAQRAKRHGSHQRRSLEPDRIPATAHLRKNIRIKPKNHQLVADNALPPWPKGPGLVACRPKLIH